MLHLEAHIAFAQLTGYGRLIRLAHLRHMRQMTRGKSIHVDQETHERLKSRGNFGESFCDVIKRLLDCVEMLDSIEGEFTYDEAGNLVSFEVGGSE